MHKHYSSGITTDGPVDTIWILARLYRMLRRYPLVTTVIWQKLNENQNVVLVFHQSCVQCSVAICVGSSVSAGEPRHHRVLRTKPIVMAHTHNSSTPVVKAERAVHSRPVWAMVSHNSIFEKLWCYLNSIFIGLNILMHKKNISQVKLLQNIDHWEDQLIYKTHSNMDRLCLK